MSDSSKKPHHPKPNLSDIKQVKDKLNLNTEQKLEKVQKPDHKTENKKPDFRQKLHKIIYKPWFILVVVSIIFGLFGLVLCAISLQSEQKLMNQNAELKDNLTNLSRRLGLTESEISNLNKPTISQSEVINKAAKSVVVIEKLISSQNMEELKTKVKDNFLTREADKEIFNKSATATDFWEQLGSGVILDKTGLIITNKHIVGLDGNYRIRTIDDKVYPVTKVLVHPYEDIALIQASNEDLNSSNFTPISINSNELKKGEEVYAIGHPLHLNFSVSKGVISNPNRNFNLSLDTYLINLTTPELLRRAYFDKTGQAQLIPLFINYDLAVGNMVQHTATINLGSSGGALIDSQGNLVGLNTFGVERQDVDTFNLVPGLEKPFQAVEKPEDLQNKIVQGFTPTTDFNLNGAIKSEVIAKVLDQYYRSKQENKPFEVPNLGFYINTITPSKAALFGFPTKNGVQIFSPNDKFYNYSFPAIDPNGLAINSGLKENDIITALDGVEITESTSIGEILLSKKPGDEVKIKYFRQAEDKKWMENEANLVLGKI